jgi:two-component system NtrC family response regulator
LGSTRSDAVDAWVIAATSEDLDEAIRARRFREDLYHRLAVLTLRLPPLRERGDDAVLLSEHFLARACDDYGLARKTLTREAHAALSAHAWPGNVRELANVIEHATILCDDGPITAAHLPSHFNRRQLTGAAASHSPRPISLRDLEMQAIYQALERNGGSKPKAADELGISLKTLYNKLNQASDLEKSA